MVYYLSLFTFKQSDMAFVASCLYAFYPSSIIYTLTPSPEHMGIACFMTMAVLLAKCASERTSAKRLLLLATAAGVVAGLGNSVKPIFALYAIATAICLVVATLQTKTGNRHRTAPAIAAFLVVITMEACTFNIALRCSERMFNSSFRDTDPTPHCLCVGLNRQGEGQIHIGGLSRTWHKLIAEGKTTDIATRMTYDAVAKDWLDHPDDVLPFFAKKFVWTWQDDNRPFGMAMLQLGKKLGAKVLDKGDQAIMSEAIVKRELGTEGNGVNTAVGDKPSTRAWILDTAWQSLETAGFVIYFVIMILTTVGVIWYGRRSKGNIAHAWVCLFVLGFWGLMVLSEASSRYKCLIMPYVFILMAPFVTHLMAKRWNVRDSQTNSLGTL